MVTARERTESLVKGWEQASRDEFFRYDQVLRSKFCRLPSAWGEQASGPYWAELPLWLSAPRNTQTTSLPPEFTEMVLWGQSCLFYAVRIQDDLLDGTISRSPLALAPLRFHTEADRAFSSVIDRNAEFWVHYWRAVEATVAGIVSVAEMQRDPNTAADELLEACGSVDAIFTVGSAAVCERIGRLDWIAPIDRFVSELGKILLSIDDLDDIEEDLADGRVNYPARLLLAGAIRPDADLRLLAKEWRQHADAAAYGLIQQSLRECLLKASEAMAPLALDPVSELIERVEEAIGTIGTPG